MLTKPPFDLVFVDKNGNTRSLITGRQHNNYNTSARALCYGVIGASFGGGVVSCETNTCYIPSVDSEGDDPNDGDPNNGSGSAVTE